MKDKQYKIQDTIEMECCTQQGSIPVALRRRGSEGAAGGAGGTPA